MKVHDTCFPSYRLIKMWKLLYYRPWEHVSFLKHFLVIELLSLTIRAFGKDNVLLDMIHMSQKCFH